jgi:hypothetical protein
MDYNIVCFYDTTETYQQALLTIFHTEYCMLVEKIQALYDSIEKTEKLKHILGKMQEITPVSNNIAFFLLFSYEYFAHTHAFLKEETVGQTSSAYESLCSIFLIEA